jgi:hypothetical protein
LKTIAPLITPRLTVLALASSSVAEDAIPVTVGSGRVFSSSNADKDYLSDLGQGSERGEPAFADDFER